jgi:hypothetical protein
MDKSICGNSSLSSAIKTLKFFFFTVRRPLVDVGHIRSVGPHLSRLNQGPASTVECVVGMLGLLSSHQLLFFFLFFFPLRDHVDQPIEYGITKEVVYTGEGMHEERRGRTKYTS